MNIPAMQAESVLETVLYADDLDAVEQFYGGVLGLENITRDPDRHIFFRCGSQVLLIFDPHETEKPATGGLPVPSHGAHGPGHICFRADGNAIERWRVHLEAAGIAIESDMVWPSGGRSIYFRDPSGNCLEFAEPKIWGL